MELANGVASRGCGPQDRPLRRDDVVFHELDGEALLYDGRNGVVHRFNTVTLFVWDACDGCTTAADIARAVTRRYAIAREEALLHVERVIVELKEKGLLQDDSCSWENPFSHPAGAGIPSRTTSAPPLTFRTGEARRESPRDSRNVKGTAGGRHSRSGGLSRRELLSGGATKLVFVAPLISSFIAVGAYASGGTGLVSFDCKLIGFSCAVQEDCCEAPETTDCQGGACCKKLGKPCETDAECCSNNCNPGPDLCGP